ncbi:MAG: DUF554 domain-containing protein [Eubacteriaceae bacterium]|nr:DUF554 domain-containing protein [Eubacteriaceae bacterium]
MFGSAVNALAVVLGGGVGLMVKRGLPEKVSDALINALGLCVLYIGISGCFEGQNPLIAIISMAVGTFIGSVIDLDHRLSSFAEGLEKKFVKNNQKNSPSLAEGFVTTTMLVCVGAMAVVGSIQSGLSGDNSTLFSKAVIDGISCIVLGSTLGAGVMLAAVPLFIYQGGIAALAGYLAPYLTQGALMGEITCVGSLMIIAIALNMMKITDIKVMNMLPGIIIPVFLCMVM